MRLSTPEILQRHGTGLGFPWQASEAAWIMGYTGARAASGRSWRIRPRTRAVRPVQTEVPGEQLLFVPDLVILGWKGDESRELLPLKNKFPLGGLA